MPFAAVAVAAMGTTVVAQMASASVTPRAAAAGAGVSATGTSGAARAAAPMLGTLRSRPFQPHLSGNLAGPTIPFYSSSFTFGGKKYAYRSVGTNPQASTASTHVPVTFIPIKFVEPKAYAYPTGAIGKTAKSALFTNNATTNGTQYGDATLRSSYNKYVQAHGGKWHVLLGKPAIKPLLTVKVPGTQGGYAYDKAGHVVLVINVNWLATTMNNLAKKVPPQDLAMFLTYDSTGCSNFKSLSTCGIGGFHSAVSASGTHTYAWASWFDSAVFGATFADVAPMSHEVAEWLNDPFVNDLVPAWKVPSEPQYGCSNYFEVGDPLVGKVFTINGLHYQDEADFSWFARQKPSIGANGYSYLGTFKTYSPAC